MKVIEVLTPKPSLSSGMDYKRSITSFNRNETVIHPLVLYLLKTPGLVRQILKRWGPEIHCFLWLWHWVACSACLLSDLCFFLSKTLILEDEAVKCSHLHVCKLALWKYAFPVASICKKKLMVVSTARGLWKKLYTRLVREESFF